MHDSSAMPFLHIGLVVILLLAFVAMVAIKKFGNRRSRERRPESSEAETDG
jgi:flagellar biogenesis protein FliO